MSSEIEMARGAYGRWQTRVQERLSQLAFAVETCVRLSSELEDAKRALSASREAQAFTQTVAQSVQQRVHNQIASVVTRSLQAVFDDPYQFAIRFELKRGRTEAQLIFIRNGIEVDPLTASGGGVVDVAAFALRLSCLMLHRPKPRRILIMDEPFKFVNGERNRERLKALIMSLAEEMQIQVLMITQTDGFAMGKVIRLC